MEVEGGLFCETVNEIGTLFSEHQKLLGVLLPCCVREYEEMNRSVTAWVLISIGPGVLATGETIGHLRF